MPSDSSFDSNIIAKDGTESIAGFLEVSATAFVGPLTGTTAGVHTGAVIGGVTGNVTGNVAGNLVGATVKATSYVKIGAGDGCKYLFNTSYAIQASIVAAATALADVAASLEGSISLAKDNIWIFTAANTATPITAP